MGLFYLVSRLGICTSCPWYVDTFVEWLNQMLQSYEIKYLQELFWVSRQLFVVKQDDNSFVVWMILSVRWPLLLGFFYRQLEFLLCSSSYVNDYQHIFEYILHILIFLLLYQGRNYFLQYLNKLWNLCQRSFLVLLEDMKQPTKFAVSIDAAEPLWFIRHLCGSKNFSYNSGSVSFLSSHEEQELHGFVSTRHFTHLLETLAIKVTSPFKDKKRGSRHMK